MNSVVPSRRLLRQLALASRESTQAYPSKPQTRTICHARQRQNIVSRPASPRAHAVPRYKLLPIRHASTSTNTTTAQTPNATTSSTAAPNLPDITNHYTLFPSTLPRGPPPTGPFSIPLPALRKEFLQIQSLHHPDKHPNEPAHSKALALSALVNNAYKTLSDPLLRAQYLLLQHYDIDVNSEDNSVHKNAVDSETLMEVMDAQERIEDAETQGQIDEIRAENTQRIEETVEALGKAFDRDDAAAATRECVRLRYWRSLGDGLHSWEPGKEVRLIH
jgi:molecular chaperone HscB